jgi:hypothetical protein
MGCVIGYEANILIPLVGKKPSLKEKIEFPYSIIRGIVWGIGLFEVFSPFGGSYVLGE